MSAAEVDRPLNIVEAPINYLAVMAEKPYSYTYAPPEGIPQTNRRVTAIVMPVRDARTFAGRFSLEREGFALVPHVSAVRDFYNDAEVKAVYYPECERLLREATGAPKVV